MEYGIRLLPAARERLTACDAEAFSSMRRHGVRDLFVAGTAAMSARSVWTAPRCHPSAPACAVAAAVSLARRLCQIGLSGPTDYRAAPSDDVVARGRGFAFAYESLGDPENKRATRARRSGRDEGAERQLM
jgi:hypothetical protein